MNDVKFRHATPGDLAPIERLLADSHLPNAGMDLLIENTIVAEADSSLVGAVGLEPYGRLGLLRSLAVPPEHRGHSLGRRLCAKIIHHARLLGVEEVYLLTTDADRYFSALGFERVERDEVPSAIRETAQFRSVCPATAVCMTRNVSNEVVHASSELLPLRPDVPGARMWAVSLKHTMLTYFEVDPGSRFESHSHESEQITMVLSGELFFEVRGVVHCIKAGEVIAIPSSVPHAVWTETLAVTAIDAWSPVMPKYGATKG